MLAARRHDAFKLKIGQRARRCEPGLERGDCEARPRHAGRLTPAKALAAIGEAAGISLYGGTMLEGGVGTVASAQLFATFNDIAFGMELFGPLLLTEEILAEPLGYSDCSLAVPAGPGLGIALNPDAIAAFRRDRTVPTMIVVPKQAKG